MTHTTRDWFLKDWDGFVDIDLSCGGTAQDSWLALRQDCGLNDNPELSRPQVRAHVARLYGTDAQHVLMAHGAEAALYLFYQSFLRANDHVITFVPGAPQSWEVPQHIGCQVTKIPLCLSGRRPVSLAALEQAFRPSTRLVSINFPNNPTGAQLSDSAMGSLLEACRRRGIFVVNDEEYLSDYPRSIASRSPWAGAVGSLSQVYGLPSLNCGWFVGPPELVERMARYKHYTTGAHHGVGEQLALNVLTQFGSYVERYRRGVHDGLQVLRQWLAQHPDLQLTQPCGTPFAYVRTPFADTAGFCLRLLEQSRVRLMPGEVFDGGGALRISINRPESALRAGLERVSALLRTH